MSLLVNDTPDSNLRHDVGQAVSPTPARTPRGVRDPNYPDVDVAIVMESTYPYLKGGVSAVVHDIILGNPDLTFGIIHFAWDSNSPHEDCTGCPRTSSGSSPATWR
ncbi:DUF3492 domain-containing protein [Piscicoccus intestinalis]|uniref:DUF3492 domain-containing protein n=1 Tax=Piscicoccus intestinalis TaxID=746033 RepID=UPI000A48D314|nr:DUF3492 domain-containing protein [Piscicoccus intestinalis]